MKKFKLQSINIKNAGNLSTLTASLFTIVIALEILDNFTSKPEYYIPFIVLTGISFFLLKALFFIMIIVEHIAIRFNDFVEQLNKENEDQKPES